MSIEMSSEQGKQQHQPKRVSPTEYFYSQLKPNLILLVLSHSFMLVCYLLAFFDLFQFHPRNWNAGDLENFSTKIEYTLKNQTPLLVFLTLQIVATIFARVTFKAINPLHEHTEPRVLWFKCTLTNSLEQIFLSSATQLIFVSFATASQVLRYIPLINLIQFIGRIAFVANYPERRSFGFSSTIVPTLAMTAYNVGKLGAFYNFY